MQAVRPENYRPRAIDRRIDQLLRSFGAVEIAGPKWCGKTWTSLAHANSADGQVLWSGVIVLCPSGWVMR